MKFSYLIKNVFWYALIIFVVVTFNFALIRFMPGDPVERYLGVEDYYYLEKYYPEVLEAERARYGLDKSVPEQYLIYMSDMLRGDLGHSYSYSKSVLGLILSRLKWTLVLMLPAVAVSAVAGIFTGTVAGWGSKSVFDRITSSASMFFYVIPTYCLAMILLLVFAYYGNWFPIGGITSGGLAGSERIWDIMYHMVLPATVLILHKAAYNHLIMKNSIVQERSLDYPACAKARGLSTGMVLSRHVLPNAMLPMVTNIMSQLGSMVSGTMMVEVIFNWQGMGTLIYDSVMRLDYPLLQGCLLVTTVTVVISNICADIIYYAVDPRIKDGVADAA